MTWTLQIQRQDDAVDANAAAETGEAGLAAAPAAEEISAETGLRQVVSPANFRLVVLSVIIVVVGVGAGYIGALLLPKQYAARAELRYSLSHAVPNELLREDRRLTTQLVLLESRAVLGPVAFDNGMGLENLAKNVSADIVDSSEIIEVEVRDRTPERAQLLLTDVVDRYLALANADWQDPVRSYIESKVIELESELIGAQQQRQAPAVSPEDATGLAQREQVLRELLDPLRLELSTDPESPSRPPAQILTSPYTVAEPVSPRPLLAAATGALTALVVAALVVLLVARRRLRS